MSKLGRNDPCHCGSGKKYKVCCMEKDKQESHIRESLYDAPLLVDGEITSECEEITLNEGGKAFMTVRQKVTATDNHISVMPDGYRMTWCVLSRTDAGGKVYLKPEHAAKGFTWYIRLAPRFGQGVVAYFKDIEMALKAMDSLEVMENEWGEEMPSEKNLNQMRRYIIYCEPWPLLTSLEDVLPEA